MEASESLHPIAVLVMEMKTEDVNKRVRALSQLATISVALGAERTRTELLPYLSELVDDDPPVQLELARQLSHFSDYVGGRCYAHVLIDPLELLAAAEDAEVRNAAVKGIGDIAVVAGEEEMGDIVLDVCRCLSEGQSISSKCSSAQLLSSYFPHFPKSLHKDALALYDSLSKDSSGATRKAAAECFPALADAVGIAAFDVLTSFSSDREDGIRSAAVSCILSIASNSQTSKKSVLLPMIRNLSEDKSTRVRFAVAEKLHDFASVYGPDITVQVLAPILVKVLGDSEQQIRVTVSSHLSEFVGVMTSEAAGTHVLPAVSALCTDAEPVRRALASQLHSLTSHIGSTPARSLLIPIVRLLLQDEVAEVALIAVRGARGLHEWTEVEAEVKETLQRVAKDRNWRTRLHLSDIVSDFAKSMGAEEFYRVGSQTVVALLQDPAFSIRDSILQKLPELCTLYGPAQLVTILLSLKSPNSGYMHRITLLKGLAQLLPSLPLSLAKSAAREVVEHSADKVPHVRQNAGRAAHSLKSFLPDAEIQLALTTVLERLHKDPDPEVRNSVISLSIE